MDFQSLLQSLIIRRWEDHEEVGDSISFSSSPTPTSSPAMFIRRPQTSSWKQSNPTVPDPSLSPLPPKPWLDRDSGAVGLGIVLALNKSIVLNSPAKLNLSTAPVPITPPRPAGRRKESRQHGLKSKRWKDDIVLALSTADFLGSCCLCRKQLHGKDVYMYQAKAFCSMECRYQRIVSDELQEKCGRSRKSKSLDISCSPCSGHGRLFFTGIVAG